MGWACSDCEWGFSVPTLSGEEAKVAYDRLAAVKFREHKCQDTSAVPTVSQEPQRDAINSFIERAHMLIKRGYTPKVAVDLILHEREIEDGNDPGMMRKARADAETFLLMIRKGLI